MLYFWKKNLKNSSESINYLKIRDHFPYAGKQRGTEQSICYLKLKVANEIPVVFHNGSNYHYHFFIKELPECLGGITEKYKTCSVPIEKEVKIDKDGNEIVVTISYKYRLMTT